MRVLVTGATGMLGRAMVTRLAGDPRYTVRAAVRRSGSALPAGVDEVEIGDMETRLDWTKALESADVVIHVAARAHVMRDATYSPLEEYRRANTVTTINLAQQAAESGIQRFLFISSIKVNGEETAFGAPFTPDALAMPRDAYGVSKMEAEQGIRQIAQRTGMSCVIVRPPLVYGPGVKANFKVMMDWLGKGIPLPLATVHNKRSLVALDNLVDMLVTCIEHPSAANQTFLVSDGEDLSTSELLSRLSAAMGRPARLFSVPESLLRFSAMLLCRSSMAQRLCGSLQVDISKTCENLSWRPPIDVDEGLRRVVAGWRSAQRQA